jgi:hypothetical protein
MLKKDATANPFVTEATSHEGSRPAKPRRIGVHCVPVGNKSEARYLESCLIRAFKQSGFNIHKDADEKHRRFGSFSRPLS